MSNTISTKDRLSVRAFVWHRLGNPTGPWSAARKMFGLSFGAKSFADFWRYWSPVHHYYLTYYVYKPVRKVLPRSIAVLFTFAFCGFFLHDIVHIVFTGIPLITIWFLEPATYCLFRRQFETGQSQEDSLFLPSILW